MQGSFEEENLPLFAFAVCRPQTSVIMNDILLTVKKNAVHTMLSCGPHSNYSTVLKVTGGSLKKKTPQTLSC